MRSKTYYKRCFQFLLFLFTSYFPLSKSFFLYYASKQVRSLLDSFLDTYYYYKNSSYFELHQLLQYLVDYINFIYKLFLFTKFNNISINSRLLSILLRLLLFIITSHAIIYSYQAIRLSYLNITLISIKSFQFLTSIYQYLVPIY